MIDEAREADEAMAAMSGQLPQHVIDSFLDRCRAERAAAGLPEHVEDPDVLARIATIVAGSHR